MQTVDARKEEVFFPDLLITLRSQAEWSELLLHKTGTFVMFWWPLFLLWFPGRRGKTGASTRSIGGGGAVGNIISLWSSVSVPSRLPPLADISTPPGQDAYVGQTRARCPYFEHLKHWDSLLLHVTAVCPVRRHSWHEILSDWARGAMGSEEGMWWVGVSGWVGMSMSGVGTVLAWDRVGPWMRACLVAWWDDVMSW